MIMKCFKPYDVFISHAVEDKLEVADTLTKLLKQKGLRVWYSGDELRIGNSLAKVIESGLRKSKYGIAILSKNYIQADWAREELETLLAYQNVLPIKHKLSSSEIHQYFSSDLADTWALSTDEHIEVLAYKIHDQIREKDQLCALISWLSWAFQRNRYIIKNLFTYFLTAAIILFSYLFITTPPKACKRPIKIKTISIDSQSCIVSCDRLSVYKQQGREQDILRVLTAGYPVTILNDAETGIWTHISVDGISGYVLRSNLDCSTVWICLGLSAYAYHNNIRCTGLSNCEAEVIQVPELKARRSYERRRCKDCYGRQY